MNTPETNATPLAGGAGGNVRNLHPDSNLARLPLTPPAHHNAPPGTSEVAAERIAGYAATQRVRIRAFIAGRGADGCTDDEGEAALAIKCQSYTPRRNELVALGLVVDSGRRRKTSSGCPAAVWVLREHSGAEKAP